MSKLQLKLKFPFFSSHFRVNANIPILNNNKWFQLKIEFSSTTYTYIKWKNELKWANWHNMLNRFEMNHILFDWEPKVQIPCNFIYYTIIILIPHYVLHCYITCSSIYHSYIYFSAYLIWCVSFYAFFSGSFIHLAIFVNRLFSNCHFSNAETKRNRGMKIHGVQIWDDDLL